MNNSFEKYGILTTSRVCGPCVKSLQELSDKPDALFNKKKPSPVNTAPEPIPDKNSIDSMLELLMEERQLPGNAREKMRAIDVGQKWMIIMAHRQESASADKEKTDPTYWVDTLKTKGSNITASDLKTLLMTLRGQTKTWMLQFMKSHGLAIILEIIHSSKQNDIKLAALQCTTALLDTDVGLRQFIQLPAALSPMAMMCKTEEDVIRVEILGLLSFVATADLDTGYPLVYEALTQPALGRHPFRFLVEILSTSTSHDVKYEIMVLINALINAPDHLEDRIHTREQFLQADIMKAIAKVRDIIAAQLLEGTAAAYSVVPLQNMNSSLLSPTSNSAPPSGSPPTPASPQRRATQVSPPVTRPPGANVQGMALSHILEQLFVQCDLFESAMLEDKSESTRSGIDYSDMVSLQSYIRTDIAPRFSEFVLPIHQLIVAAPLSDSQGKMVWSTLLAVLRRLLGHSENPDPSDLSFYYNPVSYQEIFALTERAMFDAGAGPKTANVDNSFRQDLENQRAELHQSQLQLSMAQEEIQKQRDFIEKMKSEARHLREAISADVPPPPSDDIPPPPADNTPSAVNNEQLASMNKQIDDLRAQLEQARSAAAAAAVSTPAAAGPTTTTVVTVQSCAKCAAGGASAGPVGIDPNIPICPDLFDEGLPTGPSPAVGGAPAAAAGPVSNIPICPDLFDEGLVVATAAPAGGAAAQVSDIPICPDIFDEGLVVASAGAAAGGSSANANGVPHCPDIFDEGLPTAGGASGGAAAGGATDANGVPHCPDIFDEGLPTNAPKAGGAAAGGLGAMMANRAGAVKPKPAEVKIPMPYVKKTVKPAVKMRAVHWAKVDDKLINESIWKDINDTRIKLDYKELEGLFCQSAPRAAEEKKEADTPSRKAPQAVQAVQIVEGQRQQNIAIAISRFKPLSNEQIRDAILNLDDKALPIEKVSSILKWLPTPEELEAISAYDGPASSLGNVEKYFAVIGQIPRVERRLEIFQFKLQFDLMFEDVSARIKTCLDTLQSIYTSKRIKNLLEYVLAFGNFFNAGTNKGEAYGFKLQYLTKLANTKTIDNKSNLLNYLLSLVDKDPENVGNFNNDIALCPEATRIELPTLQADITKITVGVRKAANEVKSVKDPSERFAKIVAAFVERAAPFADNLTADLEKMTKLSADIAKKFGEDPAQFGPDAIFGLFSELHNQVKSARQGMEKAAQDKQRQELMAAANAARVKLNADKKAAGGVGAPENDVPAVPGRPFGPGGLRKTDHSSSMHAPPQVGVSNDLAAALARRKQGTSINIADTPAHNAEPPSPSSATLRTQVDSALRGQDSADIMKEILARRAARGGQGTKRLFGGSVVAPPSAPPS